MADGKYGRLYTDADIRKLAARWLGDRAMGPDIMAETLDDLERAGDLTFPADEPLFLLRGKDTAATMGVGAYLGMCARLGSPGAHLQGIEAAVAAMTTWQAENPARLKVPD
jgi:hypothetical protein